MKEFKAALFDLDGTLVDSEGQYTIFWGEMGRKYRPDVPDLAYRIKGTTLVNILSTYFPDPALQEHICGLLLEYERQMRFPLIDGAEQFVADLKANGVKCAIVTSSDQDKMKNVWRALMAFLGTFDAILTSEDFSASKPDPDCYLRAAERVGEDICNCVVFEDALTGLAAGMNAGMFTVGLATGNPREKIIDKCSHVIGNYIGVGYDDICQWINE